MRKRYILGIFLVILILLTYLWLEARLSSISWEIKLHGKDLEKITHQYGIEDYSYDLDIKERDLNSYQLTHIKRFVAKFPDYQGKLRVVEWKRWDSSLFVYCYYKKNRWVVFEAGRVGRYVL